MRLFFIALLTFSVSSSAFAESPKGTAGGKCYGNDTCNDGLACLKGKCLEVGKGGGPCKPDDTCDAGAVCKNGMCAAVPEGTEGGVCYGNQTCNTELECFKGLCVNEGAKKAAMFAPDPALTAGNRGGACLENETCLAGYECIEDRCWKPGEKGERCRNSTETGLVTEASCDFGLACDDGLCSVPSEGTQGGACFGNGTCADELNCFKELCVTADQKAQMIADKATCASSCARSGHCTAWGGKCLATTESDCQASTECLKRGLCSVVEGYCQAAKDNDCRASTRCAAVGLCGLRDMQCVAVSDADCAAAGYDVDGEWVSPCLELGECGAIDGQCLPTKDEHCKNTDSCTVHGRCSAGIGGDDNGPACVAKSDTDCAKSKFCETIGACGVYKTYCRATAAEHCSKSQGCQGRSGLCSVGPNGYCTK
ncbi:MAG: hypothetical protein AUK47_01840 [Deltaproteobacteria bacterium CG2_30_63_29]|nr:MAG: hypothetical protein AUK47_01840 [Deltaproteobacteria bacterium CG2_30_63_29]PIV98770.1 MAG: hypothetical protein COW42_13245 [Deltaproteobacteria bacterium CG17_big_fil_post_rev_8_21_14_2_50_63_7]